MKRKIKLIASDLDGTLLHRDKTLSPYTQSVLKQCRGQGVLLFAVTARPPRALADVIPGLETDGAVCHNGAVAVLHGEIVWEQGIDPDIVQTLTRRILTKFPHAPLAEETGGELYANFNAAEIWPGAPYIFTDYSTFPDNPSEKLIVELSAPGDAAALRKIVPEGLSVVVSENRIAMIQPDRVEKGRALEAVCQKLGIPPAETVGFGDDWNDIPLLRACGTGVAMANALPEVKAAADCTCGSNEEDGVAHWLEEHLLRHGKSDPGSPQE